MPILFKDTQCEGGEKLQYISVLTKIDGFSDGAYDDERLVERSHYNEIMYPPGQIPDHPGRVWYCDAMSSDGKMYIWPTHRESFFDGKYEIVSPQPSEVEIEKIMKCQW